MQSQNCPIDMLKLMPALKFLNIVIIKSMVMHGYLRYYYMIVNNYLLHHCYFYQKSYIKLEIMNSTNYACILCVAIVSSNW